MNHKGGRHKVHRSAGKGSSPRPVNLKTYGENYEAIFRKGKKR